MRTLVIVHVHYPQFWPELAECIRNIDDLSRLIVTYGDELAVDGVRDDFPAATLVKCANVGYDVWPFLSALATVDLAQYDLVVKLHTKRNYDGQDCRCCHHFSWLGAARWRRYLLAPFASPRAWRKTRRKFSDPAVGMVSERHVVCRSTDVIDYEHVLNRSFSLLRQLCGVQAEVGHFVIGTMFAVRAELLRDLQSFGFKAADFEPPIAHRNTSLAHVLERVFGFLVEAKGRRIAAYNGSVERRRSYYLGRRLRDRLLRLAFRRLYADGLLTVRLGGVTLWKRRLPDAPLPLVSVLMPSYNHERYVVEAVRSVLAQDYPRIELLALDDGSRDATWDRLKELQPECEARLERVVFKAQANAGLCATANALMAQAQGEYVLILASDDRLLAGALSALAEPLRRHPEAVLSVGQNLFVDDKSRRCYWNSRFGVEYSRSAAAFRTFNAVTEFWSGVNQYSQRFGDHAALVTNGNHVPNGCLVRRSAFGALPPFVPQAPLADYWSMLQLAKVGRFVAIPVNTFAYRCHNTNTVGDHAHMVRITEMTLDWEERLLRERGDVERLKAFQNRIQFK